MTAPRVPRAAGVQRLWARLRSLGRGLFRRGDVESEMAEEFRHHLDLRTEHWLGRGLSPREARRRARVEFGNVEALREEARVARGLRPFERLGFSWLDLRLGARMLVKYPGLSLVSVLGMSIGIAIGAGGFGFIHALVDAPLPLAEGERVVSLQNSDARRPGSPDRRAAHDFLLWRDELATVRGLSAFRTEDRALEIPGGPTASVRLARMTASGFGVARVAPVLGRTLVEDDERPGAPPVLVIAREEWERRFDADLAIIGRTVRLDGVVHTIVGVMPRAFRFPVSDRFWAPLHLDASTPAGEGPEIMMFGRLADGATLGQAQAEVTMIGRRMAATHPRTHEYLRPWVRPYTQAFAGIDSPARAVLIRAMQMGLSLLLVVVAVNVAALVYARTAARTGEITVRTALGATRARVVTQLFAEAIVLSLTAAALGLATARLAFARILELVSSSGADEVPFWIDIGLSPSLVAYTVALSIIAALIVGVVPALRATRRGVQEGLQRLSTRGSRMQLGRAWTGLIVAQVAVAVAVLPYALWGGQRLIDSGGSRPDYAVERFVQATLSLESETRDAGLDSAARAAVAARFPGAARELLRRLEAEPQVAGLTFASGYPGHEPTIQPIEVEGAAARAATWTNRVDVDLFTVFDVPLLAGRSFTTADAGPGSNAVIVDRVFAEQVFGGGNVIGRRIRPVARRREGTDLAPGPWLEIVGVVPAFTPPPPFEEKAPKLYRPLSLEAAGGAIQLAIRMRDDVAPATFLGRVREIARAVDPALQLRELATAAEAERLLRKGLLSLAMAIAAITGSVLLLSAAGIYAMMSFTVASRRREIGIRSALGAAPGRVLAAIFRRAGVQLGGGVLLGLAIAEAIPRANGGSFFAGRGIVMLPLVISIMLAIGLLAALGPARRGLSIQPTEALKEE